MGIERRARRGWPTRPRRVRPFQGFVFVCCFGFVCFSCGLLDGAAFAFRFPRQSFLHAGMRVVEGVRVGWAGRTCRPRFHRQRWRGGRSTRRRRGKRGKRSRSHPPFRLLFHPTTIPIPMRFLLRPIGTTTSKKWRGGRRMGKGLERSLFLLFVRLLFVARVDRSFRTVCDCHVASPPLPPPPPPLFPRRHHRLHRRRVREGVATSILPVLAPSSLLLSFQDVSRVSFFRFRLFSRSVSILHHFGLFATLSRPIGKRSAALLGSSSPFLHRCRGGGGRRTPRRRWRERHAP